MNYTAEIKGDELIIKVNLKGSTQISKSGKSDIIATTSGNVPIDTPAGPVVLGLNVYKKR